MIMKTEHTLAVEGHVATPEAHGNSLVHRRIEIDTRNGLITEVSEPTGSGDYIFDESHIILPGIIDVHVHAREDPSGEELYKESFASAGKASLHGGVTAFIEMPNNPRAPIDDTSYATKRDLTKTSDVKILLFAGVGPGTRPLSFPAPYKVYMGPSIGSLFFESEEALRQALARYRGQRVAFHAEDPEILRSHVGAATHEESRPREAEIVAIETVIEMCAGFQIEPHICHLTTAEGLDVIREARSRGIKVSTEVTPHHLYFDQDNKPAFHSPSFLQCNPPIRTKLDRVALLEAFRDGEIEYLGTDHAPHSLAENEAGMSGVPQLDTVGPFLFWLRDEGVSWETVRLTCCERPGQLMNRYLPDLYGKIAEGFVGSLTVLKNEPVTIRRENLQTLAGWSPFEGSKFSGGVSHTIVRGKVHAQ